MKVSVLIAIVTLFIVMSITVIYTGELPTKSGVRHRRRIKWKVMASNLNWKKWNILKMPLTSSLSRLKETIANKGFVTIPIRSDLDEVNIESSMELTDYERQYVSGSCTCWSSSFSCSPTIFITSLIDYLNIKRYTYYTFSSSSICSTTCSSVSSTCSQSCTTFTALTAEYYTAYVYVTVRSDNLLRDDLASQNVFAASNTTYTTSTTAETRFSTSTAYSLGCEALSIACSTFAVTTTLAAVVATAAVAAAVAVGVAL